MGFSEERLKLLSFHFSGKTIDEVMGNFKYIMDYNS